LWARFFYNAATLSRFWGLRYHNSLFFKRAERQFSRALELDKGMEQAYLNRGILRYRELGDWAGAVQDFSTIIGQNPMHADAIFNRAMAYYHGGDYYDAAQNFAAYLQVAPDGRWAHTSNVQLHMLESILDDLPQKIAPPDDVILLDNPPQNSAD